MTRPFFSRDKITHFDIFDRHADSAISLMKTRFRAGYAVDFQVCFVVIPLLVPSY